MPKRYYCSSCGQPVVVRLKALRNKGIVVSTVDPHYCVEEGEYKDNITDSEIPLVTHLSPKRETEERRAFPHQLVGDKRLKTSQHKPVTSTAPASLLRQIRDIEPSLGDDPRENGGFSEDLEGDTND